MREILFRGKANDTGKWVYGSYFKEDNGTSWIFNNKEDCFYLVDDKTVGQYTEQKDINGEKIFEGDILMRGNDSQDLLVVYWNDEASAFVVVDDDCMYEAYYINRLELFDNKYDSPELLDVMNPKEDDE